MLRKQAHAAAGSINWYNIYGKHFGNIYQL